MKKQTDMEKLSLSAFMDRGMKEDQMLDGYRDTMARQFAGAGPDYDYSMVSAFDRLSTGGHIGDIGKLPNHPTFSNESLYDSKETPAGTWEQTEKGWGYTPSEWQANQPNYKEKLMRYFNREKGHGIDYINSPKKQWLSKK